MMPTCVVESGDYSQCPEGSLYVDSQLCGNLFTTTLDSDVLFGFYTYTKEEACSPTYEGGSTPWQCNDDSYNPTAEINMVVLKVNDECLQGYTFFPKFYDPEADSANVCPYDETKTDLMCITNSNWGNQ